MPSEMPSPQQSLQTLTDSITRQIADGISHEALIQQMVQQGWPEVSAKRFVLNVARAANKHRRIGSEERVDKAKARMVRGLLWLLAGVAVLLVSLEVPHLTGGIPLLYVFAIVGGFFDFFLGLLTWYEEQD